MDTQTFEKFIQGENSPDHLIHIELIPNSAKAICYFNNNGQKWCEVRDFTPFLYIKDIDLLYGKDPKKKPKGKKETLLKNYNLEEIDLEPFSFERLQNGFTKKIIAKDKPRDIDRFLKARDIKYRTSYGDENDEAEYKDDVLSLNKIEQFCIDRKIRLFKNIEEYNQVHKLYFDLETTGLEFDTDWIFLIGVRTNFEFSKKDKSLRNWIFEAENPYDREMEKKVVIDFFNFINHTQPDVILSYNGFNFDWPMLFSVCERLSLNPNALIKHKHNVIERRGDGWDTVEENVSSDRKFNKYFSSVKFGGDSERYEKTTIFGFANVDVQHAVRRAAATDNSIEEYGLKYIAKFSDVARENRVYIPGANIYKTWKNNERFLTNVKNNKYVPIQEFDSLQSFYKKNKTNNTLDETDWKWYDEIVNYIATIDPEKSLTKSTIFDSVEWDSRVQNTTKPFQILNGRALVKEYLIDDLIETESVDEIYGQAAFFMAKLCPGSFERVWTMGNAAVWTNIMTAWYHPKNYAIPYFPQKYSNVGGLNRCILIGFNNNVFKADFGGLYPSIGELHDVFPSFDVDNIMKSVLMFIGVSRSLFKKKMKEAKKNQDKDKEVYYDNIQRPLKIIRNSYYGALSSAYFAWGDAVLGESIPAYGRMYMRLFVNYMMDLGYKALVMNTDGCNFEIPEGKSNEEVAKDIQYFNENYLKKPMEVECEGFYESTINLSKNNYADLIKKNDKDTGEEFFEIKYIGGMLRSKKTPLYIKEFIEKGVEHLLYQEGEKFHELYKQTVFDILNHNVPAVKIANKDKVKWTHETYSEYLKGVQKNGKPKNKISYMEYLKENDIRRDLGEVVYYINISDRKSHGNSVDNIQLLDSKEVELNPNYKVKYNAAKYLDAFNKKVTPLLCVFDKEVSKDMLIKTVDDPKNNKSFIESDFKMISQPYVHKDEETKELIVEDINSLFVLDLKELKFWSERTLLLPNKMFAGYVLPTEEMTERTEYFKTRMEVIEKVYEKVVTKIEDLIKESGVKSRVRFKGESYAENDYFFDVCENSICLFKIGHGGTMTLIRDFGGIPQPMNFEEIEKQRFEEKLSKIVKAGKGRSKKEKSVEVEVVEENTEE